MTFNLGKIAATLLVAATLVLPASAQTASAQTAAPTAASGQAQDFSQAERLLLMTPQFKGIKPPLKLGYRYRLTGTLKDETAFEDRVTVSLTALAQGRCCKASGEFLSGPRRLGLPEVEQAEGNPVTLFFLERDIREMNRRTKGSASYFRKRLRMALYESATVSDIEVQYRGKTVAGRQIVIRPYADDPNKDRFSQLARKQYVFVLSDAVPGTVVSIRSGVAGTDGGPNGGPTLLDEELLLDGAQPPAWPAPG
ncbi:hypothetical protein [Leptothrix discophora]|uniref:DUF3108 domain-containing protein n=1 Tax=Leptothrix discophora TaxID=89 RepID=A0ABT9G8H3_LEPDI|nr:hypothetical protein [Leptothrix discophora]MDP4302765.1 hypothetical protein [Leptothrix discophora]